MNLPGFRTDNARLVDRAADFSAHARTAEDIARSLRQALAETGQCWGSDDVGRSFAASHVEAANQTLRDVSSLPDRLGDVSTRFAETAATYQRAEDDSRHALLSVERKR
jgi:uncharacterized protein YukE